MSNLIPANRDPNVLIKEKSKHCVHVRLTQINVNPNDPQHPTTRVHIAVFTPERFEELEAMRLPRKNKPVIDWVRVSGFSESYVVHDGRLVEKEEVKLAEKPKEIDDLAEMAVKKAAGKAAEKIRRVKAMRENFNKKPSDG